MKIAIDGKTSGLYRGDCECGFSWHGTGERHFDGFHSPALPIAEGVVHFRMCHPNDRFDMRFSQRFEEWLVAYWQRGDALNGLGQATMAR